MDKIILSKEEQIGFQKSIKIGILKTLNKENYLTDSQLRYILLDIENHNF